MNLSCQRENHNSTTAHQTCFDEAVFDQWSFLLLSVYLVCLSENNPSDHYPSALSATLTTEITVPSQDLEMNACLLFSQKLSTFRGRQPPVFRLDRAWVVFQSGQTHSCLFFIVSVWLYRLRRQIKTKRLWYSIVPFVFILLHLKFRVYIISRFCFFPKLPLRVAGAAVATTWSALLLSATRSLPSLARAVSKALKSSVTRFGYAC